MHSISVIPYDEEAVVTNVISKLIKQVSLNNVEPEYTIELLQTHTQLLPTEELEELTAQQAEQHCDTEDESVIQLIQTKDVQDIFAAIESAVQRLCDIDPN
ncbi:hypothetical protein Trydic_g15022 [Trypoxylus dichotomus]